MRDTATKLYFDGGCRPNPGAMEAAVVVRGVIYRTALGAGTSGIAEWRALLFAVEIAERIGARDIVLLGDARMVIDQASGRTRLHPDYLPYRDAYDAAVAQFARVRLRHVPRGRNLAGIALALAHRR